MMPRKHKKTLERSSKIKDALENTGILLLFVAGLFVIGPIVHELGHITVLELLDCSYNRSFGVSLIGFYGIIEPICSIRESGTVFFYLSGYLGTVVTGSLIAILSLKLDGNTKSYARLSASLAAGLLMSVALTVLIKGDLARLARALGVRPVYATLTGLIMILMVSAVTLRIFEVVVDTSERQD